MPAESTPTAGVLEALGFAVFIRGADGALRLAGKAPEWLAALWPSVARTDEAGLPVAEASPFLENFLIDADAHWIKTSGARIFSGPWVERDSRGTEVQIEATALTWEGRSILLLERLGEAFEQKKSVLQKAREAVIAYQRLNAEMQKKEILLHCLAEDMTSALGNVITSLRLIELESDPAKARQLLSLASRATDEQQSLIHRVLDVFADDLAGFYARDGEKRAEADFSNTIRNAIARVQPQFAEKNVALVESDFPAAIAVNADTAHLERVVANLLENALQQTRPGGSVAISLTDERTAALLRVEDDGPTLPPETRELLFARFDPASVRAAPGALRLHFCRIAVENCHGEIGSEPREGGGNLFWVQLPRCGFPP